ncbi:MAG: VOC family protein [Gammaproteobacteria bacterium]|nr:VOC family protein [Gammaproteobacteria bacterium]
MQLLDHVSITVRSLETVRSFYLAIMSALGAVVAYERGDAIGFGERNRPASDGHSYISLFESPHASSDPRRHWCFRAASVEQVHAFHTAGLAAGGSDAGAPGARSYHAGYYAAFLLDPEGNKVEAVFHHADRAPGG